MALLFASLPVACRIFVGSWGFEGAFEVSGLCLVLGTYFHILSRRPLPSLPDAATFLDRAIRLALEGQTDEGIHLLTAAIRLSPRLWQAFQYRGELYLRRPESVHAALDDFTEAIRLEPEEPHLYVLRGQAHRLLGDEMAARNDWEMASRRQTVLHPASQKGEGSGDGGNPVSGA